MSRWTEAQVLEVVSRVSVGELRLWVHEGWVMPVPDTPSATFDEADLARIRLIRDLREEMSLDAEAVPVVLSLIDQIHGLRGALRSLAAAVDAEPEETRARICAAYRQHGGR